MSAIPWFMTVEVLAVLVSVFAVALTVATAVSLAALDPSRR